MHLDGARLWECTSFYGRSLAEIAGLFDTAYVSFYKGLGGLTGCCLAGEEDVVAEVREWRIRHGGRLFALWPYAASDLAALRRRLPLMPAYVERAGAIADALRDVPGVEIVPDRPPTTMMHLLLDATAESFEAAAVKLAEDEGIWTWPSAQTTLSPERAAGRAGRGRRHDGVHAGRGGRVIARLVRP